MAVYERDDIPKWEERLEEALRVNTNRRRAWMYSERCSIYRPDTRDVKRAQLMLRLLQLGFTVEEIEDGFLVNDRFVLAVAKQEFRLKNGHEWTAYQSLKELTMGRVGSA